MNKKLLVTSMMSSCHLDKSIEREKSDMKKQNNAALKNRVKYEGTSNKERQIKSVSVRKKKSYIEIVSNVAIVLLVAFSVYKFVLPKFFSSEGSGNTNNVVVKATINEMGDMSIPLSEVSMEATFYEYDHDGHHLEVMTLLASDGSVRTAFNTCQICYSSGRGYYIQDGDYFVCQNCGNRFHRDDVEISKGGCNPVPIFDAEVDSTDTEIIISSAYLADASSIFENWKRS